MVRNASLSNKSKRLSSDISDSRGWDFLHQEGDVGSFRGLRD